jgi:hypothetical protein
MLTQATKSFTAGLMQPDTGVMKTTPAREVSGVPNKERVSEDLAQGAMSNPPAVEIASFLKWRPQNSGNRGVTQSPTDKQQIPNNKPKDKK